MIASRRCDVTDLNDRPYSSWDVRLDGVSVDACEDLAALANGFGHGRR